MQRVLSTFDAYQKARIKFVQSVAQLSLREENVNLMENAEVLKMLRPLLSDHVPSIRQSASVALARLASHSQVIAEQIVQEGLIVALVGSMKNGSSYDRKAGAFAMRSVSKHSSKLASSILKVNGSIDALKLCLNDVSVQVKESGVWVCNFIAKHEDSSLATQLADAGIVSLLNLCLEEPEPSLKRIATISLANIAKHSVSLAQQVVDAKALESFNVLLSSNDLKLKRQVCACVAQIAKHSDEMCNRVANANQDCIFRKILLCLGSSDDIVRLNALICVREVSRRSSKHADMIVQDGGVKMLLDALRRDQENQMVCFFLFLLLLLMCVCVCVVCVCCTSLSLHVLTYSFSLSLSLSLSLSYSLTSSLTRTGTSCRLDVAGIFGILLFRCCVKDFKSWWRKPSQRCSQCKRRR